MTLPSPFTFALVFSLVFAAALPSSSYSTWMEPTPPKLAMGSHYATTCSISSNGIQQYVIKIHIAHIPYCDTVGAALNYIQSKTFVLCHGYIVANISLRKIIETHQQRHKNDTSTSMTCLFKNAHYKQRIPISDEDEEIEINHNLIDYDIVFEDNFDYESIHELFEGVIRSEIYNYKIYASFLNEENEYASRVIDWHSYNGITFDIIERWTYPLVLDSNTISHNYIYQRNNIYKEDKVKIGLNTEIIKNTILGYNTSIGNNCIINKSVIGINCIIGNNTHITNSFILLVILQIYLYYSNWHKWYRNGK
eukprot:331369_1